MHSKSYTMKCITHCYNKFDGYFLSLLDKEFQEVAGDEVSLYSRTEIV